VSARITSAGKVYQLDRAAEPEEVVTEADAGDVTKLSKLLMRVLKDVATLKRRFVPRRIDFEDRTVLSGDIMRLDHGFDSRVRWWVVDWDAATPGDIDLFIKQTSTNTKTLVLMASNSGTVTIRVEEAG
jgi:hypothetical protein